MVQSTTQGMRPCRFHRGPTRELVFFRRERQPNPTAKVKQANDLYMSKNLIVNG